MCVGGRETSEEHSLSPKNTIEIAVVSLIVERLFQGHSSYKLTMLVVLTCCHYLACIGSPLITFSLYFWTPHRVNFFKNKTICWYLVTIQCSSESSPGKAWEIIQQLRWFLSQDKVCGWFPRRGGRYHHHIHGEEQWGWRSWVSQGHKAYQCGSHKGQVSQTLTGIPCVVMYRLPWINCAICFFPQALFVGDWQCNDFVQEQVCLAEQIGRASCRERV